MTITYSDRAAFVLNEYRYAISNDTTVQNQTASAQDIEVDTNTDVAGATQLASEYLADLKRSTATYQIEVKDLVVSGDMLSGSPPVFQANLPGFASRTGRATVILEDLNTFTTTVTMRG